MTGQGCAGQGAKVRGAGAGTSTAPEDADEEVLRQALWLDGLEDDGLAEWTRAMATLAGGPHPLTRAVAARTLWHGVGLSAPGRLLEPSVLMARLGAEMGQGGLTALPLPPAPPPLRGDARARLQAGLTSLAEAARTALAGIDRLETWRARARAATARLDGKGAPALIEALAATPILSARAAAAKTTLTQRHVHRLLETFTKAGLTKERTGQKRFRFWSAEI